MLAHATHARRKIGVEESGKRLFPQFPPCTSRAEKPPQNCQHNEVASVICALASMPVDHALDVAGLLVDLRQQDYDDGEALTHRPALPTPSPKSSIADLAQAIKTQGCGYETSDSQLKRRAPDDDEEVGSIEEKHLKRMRRNRESAAMSRNRKKCYIEELEAKVAKLTETVNSLQNENITLQHERAKLQQSRAAAGQDMHAPSSPLKAELAPED